MTQEEFNEWLNRLSDADRQMLLNIGIDSPEKMEQSLEQVRAVFLAFGTTIQTAADRLAKAFTEAFAPCAQALMSLSEDPGFAAAMRQFAEMSEPISVAEASRQGISRLRMPDWREGVYFKIDLVNGGHGPWGHLFERDIQQIVGHSTPQTFSLLGGSQDRSYVPYTGALDEADT